MLMHGKYNSILRSMFLAVVLAGLISCRPCSFSGGPSLELARDGRTDYAVVKPEKLTKVDEYAVSTLTNYLFQITGAVFPVVSSGEVSPTNKCIFIGLGAQALKALGNDPLAKLKDQEHVTRSIGQNIYLYGKGIHGNLHSVMEFLGSSLAWRWYSVYEKPVISSMPSVTLSPFNRKKGFSYVSREVATQWNSDFYYQNGMNMGSEKWGKDTNSRFVPYLRNDKFVHSSFSYIPPSPDTVYSHTFKWLERTNYFETNPNFFSMSPAGKRIANRQLCFGNPDLRKELSKNILKHLAVVPGNQIITLDAADTPDTFCYCPECKALEKKYGGSIGPIYDYLVELCGLLKEKHPGVYVKTLAYRRDQSQKPPVLPAGGKIPDNLIISFAPIEDCYFADWTHPDPKIQETYADLKAWNAITHAGNLWAWLYPNPWGTGIEMPVGNLKRNINQMRLMHQAGVRGIFTDHCGYVQRSGLSEIQSYLIYKLMQDVNCDTDAILVEFTDHRFGAAAPLARKYLAELEQGREAMTNLPPGVRFSSPNLDDQTFPYLTAENIYRWQTYYDSMEKETAGTPDELLNVRVLRRELDFATLWKWFELKKAYPDYFKDHMSYAGRITAVNNATAQAGMKHRPMGEGTLQDFLAVIQGGGQSRALPQEFAGIDQSLIKQYQPRNYGRSGRKTAVDPGAAFGYAATIDNPDMPFQFGFYQWEARNPPKGKQGPRLSLERKDIVPGEYRLYRLGTITVTPDSWIWFSAKSWGTHLELGNRLYEPGADNLWEAWVSLKFNGPSYGGTATNDQVLCDRIICVRKADK